MTFYDEIRGRFPQLRLEDAASLSEYTSFRIGGPAPLALPSSCEELKELYGFCLSRGVEPLILGAGTNILAPDGGLDRLVICTRDCLDQIRLLKEQIRQLEAEAGKRKPV